MNRFQTFQQFLATQNPEVPILGFILNLVLTVILSFILSRIYIHYGTSLSNRRMFSNTFVLIALTTMLIITIVKSSLALSLGLVGALSIVRFRAAIKEPEELAYLFLVIGIGLGMGANQRLVTIIAFVFISAILIVKSYTNKSRDDQNLNVGIICPNPRENELQTIAEVLKKYCSDVNMKRFDETKEMVEASFLVACDDFEKLNQAKSDLKRLNENLRITFLDNKGLAY